MKMKFWTFFAALISTSLLAQQATNTPAPEPAPAPAVTAPAAAPAPEMAPPITTPEPAKTNAPAKPKSTKKKAAKKPAKKAVPAAELKTTPLVAGPAVVSANHVNVRSKAGLVGEVLTHVTNGEPVTVLEEVHLKMSGPEEPSAWAKIALPTDAPVWVKSSYLDANKTVSAKKLNLRAGPSEHYGVVGTLQKGDTVQELEAKGDWTKIQAPTNAYAFVAAQYLTQDAAALAAANAGAATATPATPTEPAPTVAAVPEAPTVAAAPTEPPMTTNETPAVTNEAPAIAASTNEVPATVSTNEPTPAPEEPLPPRIVEREGFVSGAVSIQAPTKYKLVSPDNKRTINYLYTTSTNLDLSRYKGMHIIVTGEEGLDERWKNTPVITIQKILVLE